MSEFTMDRLWENLEALKMKNTLEILDNYLERVVAENLNIVEVLDHIFSEEAKSKRKRVYEKQIQMSGFPTKKTLDDFDFSFQPSIDKRQIDEIGYLPMDIQGANLFFQLIARRYEKTSAVFTSNKTFSQWNEVFADVTIASAILDRVLHHCTVINIKGESYRLKERKEFMRQKQQIVNTLFEQGNA